MMRRQLVTAALALATVSLASGPARAQGFDTMTIKPLVKAVRDGDEDKVKQALLKGENPNQIDTSAQPLLMVAVLGGNAAVVR